jgi:hypothetical protein
MNGNVLEDNSENNYNENIRYYCLVCSCNEAGILTLSWKDGIQFIADTVHH